MQFWTIEKSENGQLWKGPIWKRTNPERKHLKKDSSGKKNLKKDNSEQENMEKDSSEKGKPGGQQSGHCGQQVGHCG